MTTPLSFPPFWPRPFEALTLARLLDEDCCFGHEAALPYLTAQASTPGTGALPEAAAGDACGRALEP